MGWFKWIAAAVLLLSLAVVLGLPRLNDFQRRGRLVLSGLAGEVRVVRDEKGMAYIHAAGEEDLLPGAGIRHGPGPPLSMQLTRLFASGPDLGAGRRKGEEERYPHADHRLSAPGEEAREDPRRADQAVLPELRRRGKRLHRGAARICPSNSVWPGSSRNPGPSPTPWPSSITWAGIPRRIWKRRSSPRCWSKSWARRGRGRSSPSMSIPTIPAPASRRRRPPGGRPPRFDLAGDGELLALLRETAGIAARREQQLGHVRRPFRERETDPRQRSAPRRPDPPRSLVPHGADHAAADGRSA